MIVCLSLKYKMNIAGNVFESVHPWFPINTDSEAGESKQDEDEVDTAPPWQNHGESMKTGRGCILTSLMIQWAADALWQYDLFPGSV